MLTSYKTATNWTYFSKYFSAIEDMGNSGSGDVNLITFTIAGVEYQAEEHMSWNEWVNSKYNTDGYYIDEDDYVVIDYEFVGSGMSAVHSYETIIDGKSYRYVLA